MDEKLMTLIDSIVVQGASLKKAKALFVSELEDIEKKKVDAETKLRYAVMAYNDQLAKNTALIHEIETKKKESEQYLSAKSTEADILMSAAKSMNAQADELLKSAEKKESLASSAAFEAGKLKDEYQARVEKARHLAQTLV